MVKLFTHNLLCCAAKGCISVPKAYPLIFSDPQIVISEAEFNPTFINNMLPRIEWSALHTTVNQLGLQELDENKPDNLNPEKEQDLQLLKTLHTVLLETGIEEGSMVCANCGHIYPIKAGIPNMLLPPHMI